MKKFGIILASVMLSGAILVSCGNKDDGKNTEDLGDRYETQFPGSDIDATEEGNDLYAILRMDMDLINEKYEMTSGKKGVYTISSPAITVVSDWNGEDKNVKPKSVETTDKSVECYPGIKVGMTASEAKKACDSLVLSNVNSESKQIRLTYSVDDYIVSVYVSVDEETVKKIDPDPGVEGSYSIDAEKEYMSAPTGTVEKISVTLPERPFGR